MPAHEGLRHTLEATSPADLDERLARLFEATFPDLPPELIPTASVTSVEAWDSLQSVVLTALVEEEFGIAVSPLDLPELSSYESLREYVLRGIEQ